MHITILDTNIEQKRRNNRDINIEPSPEGSSFDSWNLDKNIIRQSDISSGIVNEDNNDCAFHGTKYKRNDNNDISSGIVNEDNNDCVFSSMVNPKNDSPIMPKIKLSKLQCYSLGKTHSFSEH